jgi:D-threo-aldose 1-dehydrogenase
MKPETLNKLGRVDLDVTAFSLGLAPIGNFLKPIGEAEAEAIVQSAWDAGVRYYDTAPLYGHGLSELRTGHSLRWKRRDDYVLSSKVGRMLTPAPRGEIDFAPWVDAGAFKVRFDYSYDGAMRSIEDSLQRLGLERIDIAFIHDPDVFTHGPERQPDMFRQAMQGAGKALQRLREQKVVKAIGVGCNEWQVCHEALKSHDFDCFLLAGRYTLLEQEALDAFLPLCVERGAAVVVGGGFNSGILATGARPGAKYNYQPAPPPVMDKVAKIEQVCAQYKVPLAAAALQFVVAHPAIPSFIAGVRSVEQLQQNLAWFSRAIPSAFWDELKRRGLLRQDAPTPA